MPTSTRESKPLSPKDQIGWKPRPNKHPGVNAGTAGLTVVQAEGLLLPGAPNRYNLIIGSKDHPNRSGVLDIETDGPVGEDCLLAACGTIPAGPYMVTGSGSIHRLFNWPAAPADYRVKMGAGLFGPGSKVDMMWQNLVLDGAHRVWHDFDLPVPDLPAGLLAAVLVANTLSGTVDFGDIVGPGESSPFGLGALRSECEKLAAAKGGERSGQLFTSSVKLGGWVTGMELALDDLTGGIEDACIENGHVGDYGGDWSRQMENGVEVGAATPKTKPDDPRFTVGEKRRPPGDEFWASRPELTHVFNFARARLVSPWALLGNVLARAVAITPPNVVLPPLVGGHASLNMFVAHVGLSGGGKGAAWVAAGDAKSVVNSRVVIASAGSGEGIAHLFARRNKAGEVERIASEVLFNVNEIDTLTALKGRSGSTLLPELRAAWAGERLGFGYVDPTKRLPIEPHSYRLCLVVGVQPGRSAVLLEDADGGTPQRFLWMPTTDPTAPATAPPEPERWAWAPPPVVSPPVVDGAVDVMAVASYEAKHVIPVCQPALDLVHKARLSQLHGRENQALDGHALLTRLKVAAALGILAGRYEVTDEDWDLAGVVMVVSDATRAGCAAALRAGAKQRNRLRGEDEADRAVAIIEGVDEAAVKRVCGVISRKLERDGGWVAHRIIRRGVASTDRQHFDRALDGLVTVGTVETQESGRGLEYRTAAAGEAAA